MRNLIFNQKRIPKDRWRYGFRPSSATGCGWIATYNALQLMDYYADPRDLIRYYERQLPLIHGNFGTMLWGPGLCFRQWGFPVKSTAKRSRMDALAKESDVCILFYRWKKGAKVMGHFIALRDSGDGFLGYNTFADSEGPDAWGTCIPAFLKQHGFFGAVLIGIKDKRGK